MEKPKMYRCDVRKKFNNNRDVYASYDNEMDFKILDTNEVRKKINSIFSSSNFIYRTKVNIVVNNKVITKKIIGLYNNNLVTIDNEYIPIDMIQDIYK